MNDADEINMLVSNLSDEWGGVVIVCDGNGCLVNDPGGEREYEGDTLLDALRAAANHATPWGSGVNDVVPWRS